MSWIGDRLSVIIRFEGRDHVTLLPKWKSPPTVEEVEAALRRGVGQTVQEVSSVEIGASQPASSPPTVDQPGY
jgi:aspartate aminotransferase-like enzyme